MPLTEAGSRCRGMGSRRVGSLCGFPPWVFPAPSFAKQALSSSVDTGQPFQSCWQRMDGQTDRLMLWSHKLHCVGYKAWKTNSRNPVYCAHLYPEYRTVFQGWENPSHQGCTKYQHLATSDFKGSNPSFGLRLGENNSQGEEGRDWCLGDCSGVLGILVSTSPVGLGAAVLFSSPAFWKKTAVE